MIHGIIYGILITFIFYFAALAIRQKNLSAMWFTFYIIFLGLLIASYHGHLTEFTSPAFANPNRSILITIIGLLYFTGAKFLRIFLNTNIYSRRIDRIILVLQWMGIGFIPINFLPHPFILIYSIVMVGFGPIFSTGASINFWRKEVPDAGYFVFGWIIGHITSGITLLRVLYVISWVPGYPYLLHAAMIASIAFFSIAISQQSRRFHEYADRDNLTGIANRRLFDQILAIEWKRNLRIQQPLSVIITNIDDFKAFNAAYGHWQGDICLKTVARIFDKYLQRAGDCTARYNNKEFIAVLPDTLASEASFLAEKIREALEAQAIIHETSGFGKILTVSLGTGTIIPNAEKTPADIILLAKDALLQAKNKGRNRVVSIDQVHK